MDFVIRVVDEFLDLAGTSRWRVATRWFRAFLAVDVVAEWHERSQRPTLAVCREYPEELYIS